MFGDDDGCVFGNVAGGFLCSLFYQEGSEAAEVDVFVLGHVGLNGLHQGFDGFYDQNFSIPVFRAIPGDFCC